VSAEIARAERERADRAEARQVASDADHLREVESLRARLVLAQQVIDLMDAFMLDACAGTAEVLSAARREWDRGEGVMGDRTKISWCDATWNPTRGCSLGLPSALSRGTT